MTVRTATPAETVRTERRLGIVAVVLACVGLSCGSTLLKLAGAPGAVVAFWRVAFGAVIWNVILRVAGYRMTWAVLRRMLPKRPEGRAA